MSTCPRCAVALQSAELQGARLEACGRCGGRWLDPEALRTILDAGEPAPGTDEASAGEGAARHQVPLDRVREGLSCPSCAGGMETFNYATDSGVILDKCPRCNRIWLDGGELERVRRAVAASRQGV